MNILKSLSYLFIPQRGQRKQQKELTKQWVSSFIEKKKSEGNGDNLSAEYISKELELDIDEVKEAMLEIRNS